MLSGLQSMPATLAMNASNSSIMFRCIYEHDKLVTLPICLALFQDRYTRHPKTYPREAERPYVRFLYCVLSIAQVERTVPPQTSVSRGSP